MTDEVVVGVDVGTTAAKVVAYRADGTAVDAASRGYPLRTPQPGWAEQDPDDVADATFDALAQVAGAVRPSTVVAIGLSTAMHSLIGLDDGHRPLTPMLTYADTRAWPQALRLRREQGLRLYHATGTPLHPMAPLAKLLWFAEERPDVCARVRRWVSIKERVLHGLCGSDVVDHSIASATGLLDLGSLEWSADALTVAGVDVEQLGRPVPTTTVVDHLLPAAARRLGLPTGTPVVVGAADGVLATLGVGAVTPGVAALTIGTSGALRVTVPEPRTDPAMRTFCYALTERRWVLGGAISNGGLVLRWIEKLLGGDGYERLTAEASDVPAGSEGIVMLPYLTGERAPEWSPRLGGVLFGLRVEHDRGHVVRAALEGVALQLRLVADALPTTSGDTADDPAFARVRASGGFVSSDLWLQIVADVLSVDLEVPVASESAAWGAAVLALHALRGTGDTIDPRTRIARTVAHDAETSRRYQAVAERYGQLVDHMAPLLRGTDLGDQR